MILVIDTSDGKSLSVVLAKSRGAIIVGRTIPTDFDQSAKIFPLIEKELKASQFKLTDLKGIGVIQGPGGFTSLRIGISTANALAYALQIPVVGISLSASKDYKSMAQKTLRRLSKSAKKSVVIPRYGREPNITRPKKA